jgi:predicted HTH transcriptional regulator
MGVNQEREDTAAGNEPTDPSVHRGISKRARELLSSGENKFVDYKVSVKGLDAEDLVAFANSKHGGTILIGVREVRAADGRQIGEPVGHPVDDATRLQIMGKALSCSPPVQIEVIIENLNSKPFHRLEIPSGSQKPYATSSGTYKIREHGRNDPLRPEQLLTIFLEREGEEFQKRFKEATARLDKRMVEALRSVEKLGEDISSEIAEIGSTLGWAEYKAGDAANTIEVVQQRVVALFLEANKQTRRLRAIAKKVDAKDPIRQEAEDAFRKHIMDKLTKSPELINAAREGKTLSLELEGEFAAELDEEAVKRLFKEAVDALSEKAQSKP